MSYLVVVFFHEAAKSQTETLVWSNAPIHRVYSPWCLVFVDFFSFSVRHGLITFKGVLQQLQIYTRHTAVYCFLSASLFLFTCQV